MSSLPGIVEEELEFVCDPQNILPSVRPWAHSNRSWGSIAKAKPRISQVLGSRLVVFHIETEGRRPGQLLDERGARFGRIYAVVVVFHVRYRLQLVIGKQFFLAAGDGQPGRRGEIVDSEEPLAQGIELQFDEQLLQVFIAPVFHGERIRCNLEGNVPFDGDETLR